MIRPALLATTLSASIIFGAGSGLAACTSRRPSSESPAAPAATPRQRFQEMFARAYFPGRTGQLLVVPRQDMFITRDDPALAFMHGSPWPHDTEIPILFAGPQVKPGVYDAAATQQDVAPTIAAALGTSMPASSTGRVLPVLVQGAAPPRAVFLIVLDAMRRDYFDRHAAEMPTLSRLRKNGAWMSHATVNYVPTSTAIAHSTISTGTDPRIHGITGNNLYDHVKRRRHDSYAEYRPGDLLALTLSDVWQLERGGKPVVIAVGPSMPAATALAGHGACQLNGTHTTHASYNERTGRWATNRDCYASIDVLADADAKTLWPADGLWMGHKIDSPSEVRRSALFPRFEADAVIKLIESSSLGKDQVADLVLLNFKAADYVAHKHGPASPELRATLVEMDKHLARMLTAIEAKVGTDYLIAVAADHGMPDAPSSPSGRVLSASVIESLNRRFDPGRGTGTPGSSKDKKLVPYYEPENAQIFVDMDRAAALGVTLREMASFLETQPYIFAAFTEDEIRAAARTLR
jgi:predicted AlkP superfamily pyrophosphatase or phosphodiesterase